ncbi:hypothetical protein DL93DRAFT_2075555 [Clavulina sp. PMI_390]|nr:hypothetical protein DL93DRAFT_2075555 [Clavulina sp. PMI_390]
MLYTLSVLGFIGLLALAVYYYRHQIAPYLPERVLNTIRSSEDRIRSYIPYAPLSTFEAQRDAGLSSGNFDLEGNIAGDSRTGLDGRVAEEIRRIMREQNVTFDQARLIRHREQLVLNGIDPNTGLPLDAKAVTRL